MAPDRTEKRTRVACTACRSVKQRCDGPPGPCRRCQLFSYECEFHAHAPASHRESNGTSNGTPAPVPVPAAPMASTSRAPLPCDVPATLREISQRLGRLEKALRPAGQGSSTSNETNGDCRNLTADDPSPLAQIQMYVPGAGDAAKTSPARGGDAISRNLLSMDLAEKLFVFYYEHLHPSIPIASLETDRDPGVVRRRCPLLFHTILEQAAYHMLLDHPAGRMTYRGLVDLLAEGLGGSLLFTTSQGASSTARDTALALALCVSRKMVYTDSSDDLNADVPLSRQIAAKLNYEMGYTLSGLVHRLLLLLGSNQSPQRLLDAIEIGVELDRNQPLVQEVKLWIAHVVNESMVATQASRSPTFVDAVCVRAARSLANMLPGTEYCYISAIVELALLAKEHYGRAHAGLDRRTDVTAALQLHQHVNVLLQSSLPRFEGNAARGESNASRIRRVSVIAHAALLHLTATEALLRTYAAGVKVEGEGDVMHNSCNMAQLLLRQLRAPEGTGSPVVAVDAHIATGLAHSSDHTLCVSLPFAALFLRKYAMEQPDVPPLLLLTADFLHLAAPTPGHPATLLSQMLRHCVQSHDHEEPKAAVVPSSNGTSGYDDARHFLNALMPTNANAPLSGLLPLLPVGDAAHGAMDWSNFIPAAGQFMGL